MQPTDTFPLSPFQANVLFVACATPRSAGELQADAGYSSGISASRRDAWTHLVRLGYLTEHPITEGNGVGVRYAITRTGEDLANTLYDLLPADEAAA